MLTYEAGYEGFWLARDIERRDAEIDIFINDPASLRVNRRAKKKKTDRIDARRMVRALKAWDQGDSEAMSWVRVPDVDREDDKRLLRERDTLVTERTRLNNRIKGLLKLHGIFDLAPRKPDFVERLATARAGYGAPLPPRARARAEIERTVAVLRLVEVHIDMIEFEKRALLNAGQQMLDTSDCHGTAMIAALTVDNVIAAMEARHAKLTTQKSFYVEISRARDRAELVTDDRDALREQLEAVTGERIAALEAVGTEKGKDRSARREDGGAPARQRDRTSGDGMEKARAPRIADRDLGL